MTVNGNMFDPASGGAQRPPDNHQGEPERRHLRSDNDRTKG